MGADRQRAAGTAFGWGVTPSRVRPNKSFPGGCGGAKPPASSSPERRDARKNADVVRTLGGRGVPSLDTQATSRTQRPFAGGSGTWARAFRQGLAGALGEAWPARAHALRNCGVGAVQLKCKACSTTHLVPFRCGARTCPTCARIAAAAIAGRIAARVAVHD
ncbi:MAG: transposase zinc-binding domain-containing protein, partial [Gemmatimonadaceae bacterium]